MWPRAEAWVIGSVSRGPGFLSGYLDRNQGLMRRAWRNDGDRLSREDVATAYDDCHDSCLADDRHLVELGRRRRRRRLVAGSSVGSGEDDLEQPWLEAVDLGTGVAKPRDTEDGSPELQQCPGRKGEQIQTTREDVLAKIARPQLVAHRPCVIEELGVDEMHLAQVGLAGVAPYA